MSERESISGKTDSRRSKTQTLSKRSTNPHQTYLGTKVSNIDCAANLLNLGGVHVPSEGRGLGNHSAHHRDEWLSGSLMGHPYCG